MKKEKREQIATCLFWMSCIKLSVVRQFTPRSGGSGVGLGGNVHF